MSLPNPIISFLQRKVRTSYAIPLIFNIHHAKMKIEAKKNVLRCYESLALAAQDPLVCCETNSPRRGGPRNLITSKGVALVVGLVWFEAKISRFVAPTPRLGGSSIFDKNAYGTEATNEKHEQPRHQ